MSPAWCCWGATIFYELDMRIPAFPIIASFALLAAPAFAQTAGTTSTQPGGGSTMSTDAQQNSAVTDDTQQKLRQSLEQSGFKNVKVVPEAFLIRAKAPDGSRIVMRVTPDEIEGVIIERTGTSSRPDGSSPGQSGMTR